MNSPITRNILAAVLGYIVMVVVFFTFSVVWMVMGAGGAFEPGSWDVSTGWIAASIVLGLVAAVAGGFVCARTGVGAQAIWILVGLVIVLGVLSAIPDSPSVSGARPDDVSMFQAMSSAQQPRWVAWLNPALGVVGVLLGSLLAKPKKPV